MDGVDITVLYAADCPHVALARQRIAAALARLGHNVQADEHRVDSNTDAARLGFRGSPTILINGIDPFPTDRAPGLSCRLYPTEDGLQGAPSVNQLVEALTE